MEKLSLQQFFNNALFGVRKQGKASILHNDICRYRTEDGSRCGIGFSIPDELYSPQIEGKTAADLFMKPGFTWLRGEGTQGEVSCDILKELQDCHDGPGVDTSSPSLFLEKFEKKMAEFAWKYELEYEPPKWPFPTSTEGETK